MKYIDLSKEDQIVFRRDIVKSFWKKLSIVLLAFAAAAAFGGLIYLIASWQYGVILLIVLVMFGWIFGMAYTDAVDRQSYREYYRKEIVSDETKIKQTRERLDLLKHGTNEQREQAGYGNYNNYNKEEIEHEIKFVENRIEYYTNDLERHKKSLTFYGG